MKKNLPISLMIFTAFLLSIISCSVVDDKIKKEVKEDIAMSYRNDYPQITILKAGELEKLKEVKKKHWANQMTLVHLVGYLPVDIKFDSSLNLTSKTSGITYNIAKDTIFKNEKLYFEAVYKIEDGDVSTEYHINLAFSISVGDPYDKEEIQSLEKELRTKDFPKAVLAKYAMAG